MISRHCVISVSCFLADAARVELEYQAGHCNAVCCSDTHLFLYEHGSRAVRIYSWEGTPTQKLQLPAPVNGLVILGIQYMARGRRLVTAWGAGGDITVHHLSSAKVIGPKYTPPARRSSPHNEVSATSYA